MLSDKTIEITACILTKFNLFLGLKLLLTKIAPYIYFLMCKCAISELQRDYFIETFL